MALFTLILIGSALSLRVAMAGTPLVEAERCARWLDAFRLGNVEAAARIFGEQNRPDDFSKPYFDAQRSKLLQLYNRVLLIGQGKPNLDVRLDNVVVEQTGDILKLQIWSFAGGKLVAVGCVGYPGLDAPWHIAIEFDENVVRLTSKLQAIARSRLATK